MSPKRAQTSTVLSLVLAVLIFGVELLTPQGVAESTLYVLVILISLRSKQRRVVHGIMVLATLLTVLGFFLSPDSPDPWKSAMNRSCAILAFWVVGLVGLQQLRAEEGLQASRLNYQNVLDHMLEGAQIIDPNWRYLYVNDAAARHGRQPRESLLGRTMLEAYPGIERTALFEHLKRCMHDRTSQVLENEFVFSDGDKRVFEVSIQPVQEGLFVLTNDITERKRGETDLLSLNRDLEMLVAERTLEMRLANEQLEKELLQRERLAEQLILERDVLQTLMDNIPDTIYFKDTASRFTRINRAQAKVLGVTSAGQAIGKTDLDFFPDAELAKSFYEEEQEIVRTGEALVNRHEFNPTPDGQPRWFSATKVPIKDEQGNVTGIVGISRDITQRMLAEEALRKSEERVRLMTWATKDAVWDWDLETNQIEWGAGLQKVFHYGTITKTEDTWWHEHIHPADREKVLRSMTQALDGGMEFWSKEYRFQRADGKYADILDRAYILRNEEGKPSRMIGAMIDITDRKRAEETIRHQNEMLSSLHYITLNLLRYREVHQLLSALVEFSTSFLDATYSEILLVEEDVMVVKAATQTEREMLGRRFAREQAPLSWQVFDTHEPAVMDDYASWEKKAAVYDAMLIHALAVFPIIDNQQCLGVLSVGRYTPDHPFSMDEIQFGRFFANLTALVLTNVQLREALQEQSIRDALTGLFNRRYMEETLEREISRVQRQAGSLGIVMIDLDRFKQFNDTYGHSAGDALLREIGGLLRSQIRNEDIACRYGGEEFLLILPNASLQITRERAEHLREAASQLRIVDLTPPHDPITLSLGIAVYPEHGSTAEQMLKAADTALYCAKRAGRNQVVTAGADTVS